MQFFFKSLKRWGNALRAVKAITSEISEIFRSENPPETPENEYRWSDRTRQDMLDHLEVDLKIAKDEARSPVEIHDLNAAIQKCQRLWNIRT